MKKRPSRFTASRIALVQGVALRLGEPRGREAEDDDRERDRRDDLDVRLAAQVRLEPPGERDVSAEALADPAGPEGPERDPRLQRPEAPARAGCRSPCTRGPRRSPRASRGTAGRPRRPAARAPSSGRRGRCTRAGGRATCGGSRRPSRPPPTRRRGAASRGGSPQRRRRPRRRASRAPRGGRARRSRGSGSTDVTAVVPAVATTAIGRRPAARSAAIAASSAATSIRCSGVRRDLPQARDPEAEDDARLVDRGVRELRAVDDGGREPREPRLPARRGTPARVRRRGR